jgi:hypothetical protein
MNTQKYKNQNIAKDIADFVRDHKKHFDAYPMSVEVSNKIFNYDEYWEILDSQNIEC